MGLMFSRVARNFIKAGYFPTDEVTLARILEALDVGGGHLRIVDPCCGEGVALAEIKHHLIKAGASVEAFGIEYDETRAWHAKTLLDKVAHADMNDVSFSARSTGLLFLNPPYGYAVADGAQTGDSKKSERLELQFLKRTTGWLAVGGVLVLIVPHYVLSTEMVTWIARHFTRVQAWMAPEQQFKQLVLFGEKRRAGTPSENLVARLVAMKESPPETLPEQWPDRPYEVPGVRADDQFSFSALRLNGRELAIELGACEAQTLWPRFGQYFRSAQPPDRAPLRALSDWHLALALAAGQVGGFVTSECGRTLLVKGDTFKEKSVAIEREDRGENGVVETRVLTDIFVPVIRAIDFTEGENYGELLTIR